MNKLQLVIVDTNSYFIEAAHKVCASQSLGIMVVENDFREQSDIDCFVSPANSFGIMDGGIDKIIREHFGDEIEQRVQAHIVHNYLGQQPVGTAFVIETQHNEIPYLCHAPTMRTPSIIAGTENVYAAMRAVLLACHHAKCHGADMQAVATPGLGTGIGEMDYELASLQMALAYKHYLHLPKQITWEYALMVERDIQQLI